MEELGARSIKEMLLHEMKYGSYASAERLPRESLLAERLNISRTQLRDSLAELEREGFISRRQGLGTLINRHVLDVPVRMDLEIEFMDMVRISGHAASEKLIKICPVYSSQIAQRLGIAKTDEMLLVSRIVTADEKPVIYCEDYIPKALIKHDDYSELDLETPIFYFLKQFCGKDAYLDLTQIHAVPAAGSVAERLRIAPGTPVLFMDELDYDFEGEPIMYSRQYYVEGVIPHTVMRRRI